MLSTVQKAKAINDVLVATKGRPKATEDLNDVVPVKVDNGPEMHHLHTELQTLYDVSVNFKGVPGLVLVDIIDLDEQITRKYIEIVDKEYKDE